MQWALLFIGNIIGGLISAYSMKNRESVFLRLLSIVTPITVSVVFWTLRFKSGQVFSFAQSLQGASTNTVTNEIVTIVVTSVIFTAVSKGLGFLIAKYIETKN